MKIIIAPDSFKGSLEANEICDIVEGSAKKIFGDIDVIKLPMADGGEGTVAAILPHLKGTLIKSKVKSPDFRDIEATYGIFDQDKAIMEMAEASGITLVEERNIMQMNTYGTGQMVLDAIDKGVKTIYIGLGGSATNDCGLGFASALGVKFYDCDGNEVAPIPENFQRISDIDFKSIDSRIKDIKFVIMSDVKNPLLGKSGATYVFSRQKGSTDENIESLEKGMAHVASVIKDKIGIDVSLLEGAGAAGGLGAGLLAFTEATMQSGVVTILDILEFEKQLEGTSFVVTGEGRMDNQSAFGKVPFGVGTLCKKHKVPCYAIVGSLGKEYQEMYNHGITSIMTCVDSVMELDVAIENANQLCSYAAERVFRFVK